MTSLVLYELVSITHIRIERDSQILIINLNNPQNLHCPLWGVLSDLRNKINSHYRMLQTTNHISETATSLNPMVTPTEWTKRLTTNISMKSSVRPHYNSTWLNTKPQFKKNLVLLILFIYWSMSLISGINNFRGCKWILDGCSSHFNVVL